MDPSQARNPSHNLIAECTRRFGSQLLAHSEHGSPAFNFTGNFVLNALDGVDLSSHQKYSLILVFTMIIMDQWASSPTLVQACRTSIGWQEWDLEIYFVVSFHLAITELLPDDLWFSTSGMDQSWYDITLHAGKAIPNVSAWTHGAEDIAEFVHALRHSHDLYLADHLITKLASSQKISTGDVQLRDSRKAQNNILWYPSALVELLLACQCEESESSFAKFRCPSAGQTTVPVTNSRCRFGEARGVHLAAKAKMWKHEIETIMINPAQLRDQTLNHSFLLMQPASPSGTLRMSGAPSRQAVYYVAEPQAFVTVPADPYQLYNGPLDRQQGTAGFPTTLVLTAPSGPMQLQMPLASPVPPPYSHNAAQPLALSTFIRPGVIQAPVACE